MNGRERILAALNGEKVDRLPIIPFVLAGAAKFQDYRIKEYVASGEIIARCQLALWQKVASDGLFVGVDNSLEAEVLGSKLFYPQDDYPYLENPVLERPGEIKKLVMPTLDNCGRMLEMFKACQIIRRQVGREAAIIAKVVGPLTISGQLLGLEKLLFAIADEPQDAAQLISFAGEVSKWFALELAGSGADIIMIFDPVASPSVVPAAISSQIVMPCYQQIFSQLKEAGVAGRWLQMVGPMENLATTIGQLDVNMVSLDFQCNFRVIREKMPQACLVGNVKPLLFQTGKPELIKEETIRNLQELDSLTRIIISSSCEIPLDAPLENIAALVAVRDILKEMKD